MIFLVMLGLASLLGGGLGAVLAGLPGRRRRWLPTALLLGLGAAALLFGLLSLRAGLAAPRAVLDRFFPDRLSKLAGCGLLTGAAALLGLALGVLRAGGAGRYLRRVLESHAHRLACFGLLLCAVALSLGCAVLAGDPPSTPVRLSEVCCANFTLLADPDSGSFSDYVELVNTGDSPVELGGCFLSDNGKKRGRFRLPALTLQAGECVVLWADGTGKSGTRSGKDIHLNFSISPGETVWLSSPYGLLLDRVTVPEQYKNVSLSRMEEGWTLAAGTPGQPNEGATLFTAPTLPAPTLSLSSGFYDEPQTLQLLAEPGLEIRYTLDGSVPNEESALYTAPLTLTDRSPTPNLVLNHPSTTPDRSGVVTEPVDKATVLRAAAFNAEGERSETVSAVYFVGADRFDKYRDRLLLNITVDPNDLFGRYGIAVTGRKYDQWYDNGKEGNAPWPQYFIGGRVMERDARISLWSAGRELLMDESCGIRLQGDHSRAAAYKRFRLIARPLYSGSRLFSYPLFGCPAHSFFTRKDTADLIAQALAEGLELGGLEATAVSVFVNGEFYEDTYLRERYDATYFESRFEVPEKSLILISNGEVDVGTAEDQAAYLALMDYIRQSDCSDPAVYARISEQIDLENYARYVALNLYCCNTDWSEKKNYKLWRVREPLDDGLRDGRWRWLVYDMDGCTWSAAQNGSSSAAFDPFPVEQPYTEVSFLEMSPFSELLANDEFKLLFARTWLTLMNSSLTPERVQALLAEHDITDDSFWVRFLTYRPAYATELLRKELSLPGQAVTLRLQLSQPEGGRLLPEAGGVAMKADGSELLWIAGVPLCLRAEAAEGWHFVGWEGDAAGTEPVCSITPEGDLTLTAVFAPNRKGG